MLEVVGRCKVNIDVAIDYVVAAIQNYEETHDKVIWQHIYPVYKNSSKEFSDVLNSAYNKTYSVTLFGTETHVEKVSKKLLDWYGSVEGQILKCYFHDDMVSLVGTSSVGDSIWMLPSESVILEEYKDYSHLSGQNRKNLIATDTFGLSVVDKSLSDVRFDKMTVESQIDDLKSQMDEVKNAQCGVLAKMQAEIDKLQNALYKKKKEMLSELEEKKYEMELKLQQLEMTILRIDSEIYSIRCYTGEVLELKTIRDGSPADPSTPLIFYQKMKYLDEELGKIASIYRADFSDANSFEELLRCRDDVLENILPTKRGVMLVRVSKSNTNFYKVDNRNILEAYEKYGGRKVALLIRDGDRLYLAWTDDDRIYFSDDAFYRPGESEVAEGESIVERRQYESDRDYEKRMREASVKNIKESLGRAFVFTLLQGIIDNGIIKFPDRVSVTKSDYVVLSYAEGWLTTNAYGSFENMIRRCNASIRVGDPVLTTQSLRAAYSKYSYTNNDRGIGYANRTHDVHVDDCEIYPINKILKYGQYTLKHPYTGQSWTSEYDDDTIKHYESEGYTAKLLKKKRLEYYVSLHKEWSMSGTARANFLVYPDEFINLTFMNSVWLKYILTNHKADNMVIAGAHVDFAHVIPYINTAIGFVEKREHTVKSWLLRIAPEVLDDEEWPVKLSEFMLHNDIHNFSEFRTKQFVKSLNQSQ